MQKATMANMIMDPAVPPFVKEKSMLIKAHGAVLPTMAGGISNRPKWRIVSALTDHGKNEQMYPFEEPLSPFGQDIVGIVVDDTDSLLAPEIFQDEPCLFCLARCLSSDQWYLTCSLFRVHSRSPSLDASRAPLGSSHHSVVSTWC
jgi:hypothetical protein